METSYLQVYFVTYFLYSFECFWVFFNTLCSDSVCLWVNDRCIKSIFLFLNAHWLLKTIWDNLETVL